MAVLFDPLWVMQCAESVPSNVDNPTTEITRMQNIGTVNWKKGDICRGIICYTPMGSKYGTWTGTQTKCSAIGFIAYEGNWVKAYSFIHRPARAYSEVFSTVCNTFEFTVGEDYNSVPLGVYCIINNGWANGYDNQFIFVHSIQVDILRGSEKVFQYHKFGTDGYTFQAALNWRKKSRNYTIISTSAYSSSDISLKARALDIATGSGNWQRISASLGISISGNMYSSTYSVKAGPALRWRRPGDPAGYIRTIDNAFWVGLRVKYTITPATANGVVVSYNIGFNLVESSLVASPRFSPLYFSLSPDSPEGLIASPVSGKRSYSVSSTSISTGRHNLYVWAYLPSGAPVIVFTIPPSGITFSVTETTILNASMHFMLEYL